MQVDTALVLRLLAHELRSPAGVAQGYLKMIVEGRLPGAAEQQQALEQTRHAVGRLAALSRDASELASWLERVAPPRTHWHSLDGRELVEGMLQRVGLDTVDLDTIDTGGAIDNTVRVRTYDAKALEEALAAVVIATVRESPHARLTLRGATGGQPVTHLDVTVAAPDVLVLLPQDPSDAAAADLPLERGGLGLSLVKAALVFDAHDGRVWTLRNQRAAVAVRLPVETGYAS